jgi:hypothetical protein
MQVGTITKGFFKAELIYATIAVAEPLRTGETLVASF